MKYLLQLTLRLGLLLGLVYSLAGCKVVQAPLPTNAVNQVDAGINEVLQAGHAAALKYEQDVAGGFVPSAAFKATMQGLVTALNIADPLYQQYHAVLLTDPTAAEPASLSTAVTSVSTALSNITANAGK